MSQSRQKMQKNWKKIENLRGIWDSTEAFV